MNINEALLRLCLLDAEVPLPAVRVGETMWSKMICQHHAGGLWQSYGRLGSPEAAESIAVSVRTKITMKCSYSHFKRMKMPV